MADSNPFVWIEIYVQDMPRAKAFYEAVFGFTLSKIDSPGLEMWGFPMEQQKVGAGGALVKMEGVPSGPGGTLGYFGCEDCGDTAKKFADNGGKICREKFSIGPYGFISLVGDPDGNMIGLHSMK